jgi:predicted peroxiredoxin
MSLRGLTIIVAGADRARFHAALSLGAAQAALGGVARIYLHGPAVALLAQGVLTTDEDAAWIAAGQPTLAGLLDEALAFGVTLIACQTGLAMAGLNALTLDARIETGGLIGLSTTLGDDRLVMA